MARVYDFQAAVQDANLPSGVATAAANGAAYTATGGGVSVIGSAGNPPSFTVTDSRAANAGGPAGETDSNQFLVVRLSASAGNWAGVYFGPPSFDQEFSFPIRSDGAMRTYNLWLGKAYIVPRRQADLELTPDPATVELDAAHPDGFPGNQGKVIRQAALIPETTTTSQWATWVAGSTTVTLTAANANIVAGMVATASGIATGATVVSVAGTTVTLSAPTTAAAAASRKIVFTLNLGVGNPITVFPTEVPGATGVVAFLKLSAQPEGPTNMVVESCCPARAMNRVGVANAWGIRIRNMGGIAATGISLAFSSSDGLSAGNVRSVPARIPPDEDRTIFFDVTATSTSVATNPATFKSLTVTVSCAQGDSVVVTGRAWIDPAAPTGLTIGQAPAPVPVPRANKRALIGVWDFPAWTWNDAFHQPSIANTFERRSELGFYEQEDPAVSDWNIYWLVSHGVDYLNIEWVDASNVKLARYLELGLLRSRYIGQIKFQLSYINHPGTELSPTTLKDTLTITSVAGPPTASSAVPDGHFHLDTTNLRLYGPRHGSTWLTEFVTLPPDLAGASDGRLIYCCNFLNMIRTWLPYLGHASYLRTTDNKLRLSIYVGQYLYEQINTISRSRDAGRFTAARTAFLASTLGRAQSLVLADVPDAAGVAWCGQVNQNQGGADGDGISTGGNGNSTRYTDMGFVRSESYNWFGAGSVANCMTSAQARAFGETTRWSSQCNGTFGGKTIRPAVDVLCGFNHGRWVQPRKPGWVISGWTYEEMKAHLQAARTYLDTNISTDENETGREILLEALNEFGEGSTLGPCGWNQFMFLRALWEAFVKTGTPPQMVVPRDVNAPVARTTALFRWAACPTVDPVEDSNGNTAQGVTIPPGSYPEVEARRIRSTWQRRRIAG